MTEEYGQYNLPLPKRTKETTIPAKGYTLMVHVAYEAYSVTVPRKDGMPVPSGKQCSRRGN